MATPPPPQYSCLENPTEELGRLQSMWVAKELNTSQRLSSSTDIIDLLPLFDIALNKKLPDLGVPWLLKLQLYIFCSILLKTPTPNRASKAESMASSFSLL